MTQLNHLSKNAPPKRYKHVSNESRYLTMRDGVKIAVDVMLPIGEVGSKERFPILMIMARYWRSFEMRVPDRPNQPLIGARESIAEDMIPRGFGMVIVDARGTGASYGVNRYPWSPEELTDYQEIATWISQQAWCNGSIGACGISYEGATALRLVALGVPAVKAVIPQEIEYDVYTDVAVPGGIFNQAFIQQWSDSNNLLDSGKSSSLFPFFARLFIKGVRPVDEDRKMRTMRQQAIQEHRANTDVLQAISKVVYRDDIFGDTGATLDEFSVFHHHKAIEASQVPLFSWGSWLDGASAEAVLRTYNSFSNPQVAIIGAWKHEMSAQASPYMPANKPAVPTRGEQWEIMAGFFAENLQDSPALTGKRLFYYTLGEEKWHETSQFPLPNTQVQAWYFQSNNGLSAQFPTQTEASDRYTIDFKATTGTKNRWHTQMARPVVYGNRDEQDKRLLTYTSAPLSVDLEISGYPCVTLYVDSTHTDGAFFVYLEEVDSKGVVRYLTEGQLRAIHRKLTQTPPPYVTYMPNHSFKREDALPLRVGEFAELKIGLQPVSALIRAGSRVRVAIAGADCDTFARVPSDGTPVIRVARQITLPSHIELPIIPR